jgi:hypothetical protein
MCGSGGAVGTRARRNAPGLHVTTVPSTGSTRSKPKGLRSGRKSCSRRARCESNGRFTTTGPARARLLFANKRSGGGLFVSEIVNTTGSAGYRSTRPVDRVHVPGITERGRNPGQSSPTSRCENFRASPLLSKVASAIIPAAPENVTALGARGTVYRRFTRYLGRQRIRLPERAPVRDDDTVD